MQTFLYIYIFLFCFHTPCSRKDLNRYWSIKYKFPLLFPAQVLLSWIYWHKFVCVYFLLPRKYLRRVCCMCAKSLQSYQILCDSMDRSSPGSSVYRIYQARILAAAAAKSLQSCPTLCNPMNRSMPGLPVHHQLPEFTQTHVHWVSDVIQLSHPLSSPSPLAPNPSQHQSLFQWVNSSHEVARVLEFQL